MINNSNFSEFQDEAAAGGHAEGQRLAVVAGLTVKVVVLGIVVGIDAIGEDSDEVGAFVKEA